MNKVFDCQPTLFDMFDILNGLTDETGRDRFVSRLQIALTNLYNLLSDFITILSSRGISIQKPVLTRWQDTFISHHLIPDPSAEFPKVIT